jgi:hypothetical protein
MEIGEMKDPEAFARRWRCASVSRFRFREVPGEVQRNRCWGRTIGFLKVEVNDKASTKGKERVLTLMTL